MTKLVVALLRDKPLPGKSPVLDVPMDRRIHYAISLIEADEPDADQALQFLQKVKSRGLVPTDLQDQVDQVLGHPTSNESEGEDTPHGQG